MDGNDYVDADSLAYAALRETDMVGVMRPRMTRVATRLGLGFALDVPLGSTSWFEPWRTIHLTPICNQEHLQEQVGHELGHAQLTDMGVPYERQEQYAEQVRVALQMPDYAVRRLARRHGFSPQMFVQFYRSIAMPSQVIQRASFLCGTPVILHSNVMGRQVMLETREGHYELDLPAKEERKLLRRVRESGQWEFGEFGVVAYPWRLGLHKGVAITFDLRRSLSRVVFGYAAE